jgi:translation initiation factor 1
MCPEGDGAYLPSITIRIVSNSRPVYSTEGGDLRRSPGERRLPPAAPAGDGIVRIFREKGGRGGKVVTVVRGLEPGLLKTVASDLKKLCGSGGAVKGDAVEIQGDHREKVAERLRGQGHTVKLAGG